MIVVRNNIIPFQGFKSINICGILFARKKANIDDITLNHESIHSKQIWEMLVVFFYIWYGFEWICRVFQYDNLHYAYRNISFEREAYQNESNQNYLKNRHFWQFLKYVKG